MNLSTSALTFLVEDFSSRMESDKHHGGPYVLPCCSSSRLPQVNLCHLVSLSRTTLVIMIVLFVTNERDVVLRVE